MQVKGTEEKFGLIFKSKEKKRKKKNYVAQQRVYFTNLRKNVNHAFLYISLPSLHDYDGISRFMEDVVILLPSLFLNLDMVLKNSTPGLFAYICQIKWDGIIAMKIERTRTHFLNDVSAAFAVLES